MNGNLKLQVVLAGLDKLTSPLKGITAASSRARSDLAETEGQIRALDAAQQKIGRYKAKQSAIAQDAAAYEEQRQKLAQLQAQLDATANPTKKLRAEFERAERQTGALSRRIEAGSADLENLARDLDAAGVDVGDLARHEQRLADQLGNANRELREQSDRLDRVNEAAARSEKLRGMAGTAATAGMGMIGAGVAIGAPIAFATDQAMTFEEAMSDVRKVVNFDTPEGFAKMGDDILDMSTRVNMAAGELAQIVAAAGRAGVKGGELLQFTEDAAKMAVAFDTNADAAGNTMAAWRSGMGLTQDQVGTLADQVNALTNSFAGQTADVTDVVTKTGALGQMAGVTGAQMAAMATQLSGAGVQADVAGTSLQNLMLGLSAGEAAPKAAREAFKKLGLDAAQVAKDMQRDAGGTILDLFRRLGSLDKEVRTATLTQLFGRESVKGIAQLAVGADDLAEKFAFVGDRSNYAGSMLAEYEARAATSRTATGLAGNAIEAMNIKLGQLLLPTVSAVAEKVGAFANIVRDWAKENPKTAKAALIFAGVLGALLVVLGGIMVGLSGFMMMLSFLPAAFIGALGPIGLVIAAIAAAAAVVYLIYDNWGAIAEFFGQLWARVKEIFSQAIDALISAFLRFTPLGLFIQAMGAAISYLSGLDFGTIGRNLIDGLIGGISGRLEALKATITNAGAKLTAWFKEKLGIHSPSRVFDRLGGFVMEGLDQGLAAGQSEPLQRVNAIAAGMTGALAAGAMAPAAIAAPAPAAPAAPAAQAAAPNSYAITINAGAGATAQDIAAEVRRAIEEIERDRRGRSFGDGE